MYIFVLLFVCSFVCFPEYSLQLLVFSVTCVCVCVCVCLCHGVHRQTNRDSREISEVVPAHTQRARTCRDHSHTLELRWWRVWRWFALAPHTIIHTYVHTSVYVYTYICYLFACFYEYTWQLVGQLWFTVAPHTIIHTNMHAFVCMYVYMYIYTYFVLFRPYSWLPNSLFLLDTGGLVWPSTSCRPCRLTSLPGSHRLGECSCLSWLITEILYFSESVDFLSLLDMYWPVLLVLLVCVCVRLCHGGHRQTNRHSSERSAK